MSIERIYNMANKSGILSSKSGSCVAGGVHSSLLTPISINHTEKVKHPLRQTCHFHSEMALLTNLHGVVEENWASQERYCFSKYSTQDPKLMKKITATAAQNSPLKNKIDEKKYCKMKILTHEMPK